MKPLPFTANWNAGSPSLFSLGSRLVIAGTGLFPMMVNVWAPDPPPPPPLDEGGVETVICTDFAIPAVSRSAAEIEAVNSVALSKFVVRGDPPKLTTEFGANLSPIARSVNAPLPFSLLVGSMLLNTGRGLAPEIVIVPVLTQVEICPEIWRTRLLYVSVKRTSPFWPTAIPTVSGTSTRPLTDLRTRRGGVMLIRATAAAPPSPSKPGGVPPAITEFDPVDIICTIRWLPEGIPLAKGGPHVANAEPPG